MAEIKSEYIKQELTKDGVTLAVVSIEYPVVSGIPKNAAKKINALYRHGATTLLKRIKRRYLPAAALEYAIALEKSAMFRPFEITQIYTMTYNGADALSLYREFSTHTASVRTAERYADTWSAVTGWLIGLDAFFPSGDKYRKRLVKNAAEMAAKRENTGTHKYYPKCPKLLRRHFSPDNFYVTDDGIAIFYDEDTIAPKDEGIQVFTMNTEIA